MSTAAAISELECAASQQHRLYGEDCAWPETNCYVDLWIGVLHALRLDPIAMLPFVFQADFEGDQWTFLKPSLDDLWTLYGIQVQELNLWDSLPAHFLQQVSRGHLPLVEVDSFYLPDTVGTAYRQEHTKTTIGVNALDLNGECLHYFHNGGYYALEGEDLRGILHLGADHSGVCLMPYTEYAKLDRRFVLSPDLLLEESLAVAQRHLARRPRQNPLSKFREHLATHAVPQSVDPVAYYHRYAFATVRQLGAAFQMAATYVRWLEAQKPLGVCEAAAAFDGISDSAKALLFKMARAANTKKPLQYEAAVDTMESHWELGFDILCARLGCP